MLKSGLKSGGYVRTLLPLLAATTFLAGASVGLSSCTEEVPDDPTPSPTPTAIPETPTPVPALDGEYKTTAFAIGQTGVGFDLDANGTIDNNLPVVFDTLNTQLQTAIYDAVFEANGGNAEQAQAVTDTIWAQLEAAGLVLDVDTLNSNLAAALSSDTIIYLETLTGTPTDATLDWYNGLKNGSGEYITDISVGSQSGSVDLSAGKGEVGPGSFTYQIGGALTLDVSSTLATFDYTFTGETSALSNGLLGGAILLSEIESLLRDAIPNNEQIPEDEIVANALTAIAPLMDLTLNGEAAFSVAFTFSTMAIDIGNYP